MAPDRMKQNQKMLSLVSITKAKIILTLYLSQSKMRVVSESHFQHFPPLSKLHKGRQKGKKGVIGEANVIKAGSLLFEALRIDK
jgi:hypothetical protein